MFRRRTYLLTQNLQLMLIFVVLVQIPTPLSIIAATNFHFHTLQDYFGTFLLQMSKRNAYFLVLFLAFLASSSACNARPIDVSHKEPATDFQFSVENDEKSSVGRVSIPAKVEPSLPYISEAAENGSSLTEKMVREDKQIMRAKKPVTKFHLTAQEPEVSRAVQIRPLATVSWKLPQKKRGEKQPGFNLDYAPPKTHPPVHN